MRFPFAFVSCLGYLSMGARSPEEARSFFASALRRRLGCFVAREFARYRLRRLPYIGATRDAVAARGIRRGRHRGRDSGAGVRDDDFHAYQALLLGWHITSKMMCVGDALPAGKCTQVL